MDNILDYFDQVKDLVLLQILNKYENIAFLNENFSNISYTKKQKEIIDILVKEKEKNINEFSKSIVDNLVKKKAITIKKRQVYRLNGIKKIDRDELSLTSDQKKVLNDIIKDLTEYKTHLIYGVTASGKTEVYFRLIEDVLSKNKSALVCVPEITLTQQMINRFYERFGSIVAIYHSGLSDGEKNDEYLKIYRGEAKIVVGTRSAVFAPLKNLGIIIIDEEHSDNFKQESSPRYNAIDVAKFRAKYHNIPFYIAAPLSTIDTSIKTGDEIVIEERSHEEVTHINGKIICAPDVKVINPGFDVTPHELIAGIITEKGILRPDYKKSIAEAFAK